jgi:hypothetical protein
MSVQSVPGSIHVVTDEPVTVPHPEGAVSQALDYLAEHRWVIPAGIVIALGIAVAVRRRRH